MPRYFRFLWPDDAVFDQESLELDRYETAYHRACRLVHQVRSRFPAPNEEWWMEITDGSSTPITILPAMVPRANMAKLRA